MDKVIRNYTEPLMKPMSFSESLKSLKHKRMMKKIEKLQKKAKILPNSHNHNHSEDADVNLPPKDIKIVSLALIIDDVVVDIINTQEPFSNILQKNPTFIMLDKKEDRPLPGWIYKDNKFFPFEKLISDIRPTIRG